MISDELLAILICPETRTTLERADDALVDSIHRAIARGEVRNIAGEVVTGALTGGLVRRDRAVFYPIIDHIPILLAESGIALDEGRFVGPSTAG